MDKREYTYVGYQVVDGKAEMHLSVNRYWFDLQNKKGKAEFSVFVTETPMGAKQIMQEVLKDETVPQIVQDALAVRVAKIDAQESDIARKMRNKLDRAAAKERKEAIRQEKITKALQDTINEVMETEEKETTELFEAALV